MQVITTSQAMSDLMIRWKSEGKSIGFVPTMGALHEGHISLVNKAKGENDRVVVSIFVNPNQFNNAVDLEKYPRTFDRDYSMLEKVGNDVLFFPSVGEIYPEPDTRTFHFGKLEQVMEGEFRPGHFNGVAQVVSRLFDIIKPDKAYFGEKDFQQLAIIQTMTRNLQLPITIVPCPTLRLANGLAMSSRNERLSDKDRERASIIYQTLKFVQENLGKVTVEEVLQQGVEQLKSGGFLNPEYLEVSDADTLEPARIIQPNKNYVICVAAWFGEVRLIDNIRYNS